MTFVVMWDGPSITEPDRGGEASISTAAELDAVLDQVADQAVTDDQPYAVQIYRDGEDVGLMIGVGHPERSFVSWVDNAVPEGTGDAAAHEPGVVAPNEPIGLDFFGTWTELDPQRTRVMPEAARQAAREYIETGQRPTGVEWS